MGRAGKQRWEQSRQTALTRRSILGSSRLESRPNYKVSAPLEQLCALSVNSELIVSKYLHHRVVVQQQPSSCPEFPKPELWS